MSAVTEFRMPSLGADMDSGVLLEWLVHPGDTVHKGDIVAVVDTSKAAVEVECFASGVVANLLVQPGTRVPVGDVLATLEVEAGGAAEPPPPTREPAGAGPGAPGVETAGPGPGAPEVETTGRAVRPAPAAGVSSPLVRRLAAQLQVDITSVTGTGPGGRITHADVRRAADLRPGRRVKASPLARRLATELGVALETVPASAPGGVVDAEDVRRAATAAATQRPVTERPATEAAGAEPPAAEPPGAELAAAELPGAELATEELPGAELPGAEPRATGRTGIDAVAMRATIAALMARSKREIPHYYLTEQMDLGPAMAWLHERNRAVAVPQRVLPATLLLKATARAAAEVPELNGFWLDDSFAGQDAVHLGVGIALRGGGLVAPAIHNADSLGLADLMAALRDLVTRTRSGRLRASELADPTITLSNLGDQGAESILGVIYPPQVALVGFGRIVERPWSVDGLIGVRPIVTASLAADHRATDGATGARYLLAIARLLQRPEEL